MSNEKATGLYINGRMKQSGITFYLRNGKMIARTSKSMQPERRTRKQFISRQQLAHTCRLWTMLKYASEPMFPDPHTAYARFRTLMRRTPAVFIPQNGPQSRATLLLPGMAVSDGVLPVVEQRLDVVDGMPALVTNLTRDDLRRGDKLMLFTLCQKVDNGQPRLHITCSELQWATTSRDKNSTFHIVTLPDGCLALVGSEFGDDMRGWALVHVRDERCSCQTVVTASTFYLQFTTDEALEAAAASYGGLTD